MSRDRKKTLKIEELPRAAEEQTTQEGELTRQEADTVQGGLSNTSFRVNTLTFSSNATGVP